MLNSIVIMGRLVRSPDLRKTKTGKSVVSFTLACDRDYGGDDRQTDFIDCTAWQGTAEFVHKYFAKGQMMVVKGRLASEKWQDKDGNPRTSWLVAADSVYFGEKKRTDTPPAADAYESTTTTFEELDEDGELPF